MSSRLRQSPYSTPIDSRDQIEFALADFEHSEGRCRLRHGGEALAHRLDGDVADAGNGGDRVPVHMAREPGGDPARRFDRGADKGKVRRHSDAISQKITSEWWAALAFADCELLR